jgi:hypothetical protein
MPGCSQRIVGSTRSIPAVRLQWNGGAVFHLAPTVAGFGSVDYGEELHEKFDASSTLPLPS